MAVRECRECGHPIPASEKLCPSCGAVASARRTLVWVVCGVAAAAVTAGLYVWMFQPELVRRQAEAKLTPLAKLQAEVDRLLANTATITKMQGHVIWVEPAMWKLYSQQQRIALATLVGTYAGLADGSNRARCEVRDNRNGKLIAEWSAERGLVEAEP